MKSALLTGIGKPLEIAEIEPFDLDYGQVLVKVIVSGICGAQLQEIDGHKESGPKPHPMGHEGCGIVEAVGPRVTKVVKGDKVVMHWRPGSGIEANFGRYRMGPATISGGRVTTFMEQAIVSENRITRVPTEASNELCALLGCGLSTALATLENEAGMKMGKSVLIVGFGGLGVNLAYAAHLLRASRVAVVDVDWTKNETIKKFGCQCFSTNRQMNFVEDACEHPFDIIIETSGNPKAMSTTQCLLAPSGTMIWLGQPPPGEAVILHKARHVFQGEGKSFRATQGGGYKPHEDCRRYELALRQEANDPASMIQSIVAHRYPLEQINAAIAMVRSGSPSRVMVYPNGMPLPNMTFALPRAPWDNPPWE